jgi:hypothetical protein
MLYETSASDEHSGNKIFHKPLWKTEASRVLLYVVYGVWAVLASYLSSYGGKNLLA